MAQCRRKEWILESVRSEFKSQPWPLGAVGNWARHGLSQSLGLASGGGSIATLLLEAPGRGPGPARVNCVAGGDSEHMISQRRTPPLVRAGLDFLLPSWRRLCGPTPQLCPARVLKDRLFFCLFFSCFPSAEGLRRTGCPGKLRSNVGGGGREQERLSCDGASRKASAHPR